MSLHWKLSHIFAISLLTSVLVVTACIDASGPSSDPVTNAPQAPADSMPLSFVRTATVSGASVQASGWYDKGVHDWGWITDTKADGLCVYAQTKLALAGYTDYTWNHRNCKGSAAGKQGWTHTAFPDTHIGPILSAFSWSVVQGVYVRACVDRTWPTGDTCGSWVKIGGAGSGSAL